MKKMFPGLLSFIFLLAACGEVTLPGLPSATDTPAPTVTPAPAATPAYPEVVGPDPSERVAAYYYSWYGNPDIDYKWIHWDEAQKNPPLDISSDYYPVLGAYSSADPLVVAQHFAWMRQAGVGVAITSWWGPGSNTDKVVPLLLEMGERYGVKVAFHIEPYGGRTAQRLLSDVKYIYKSYGTHPAFYWSEEGSLWSSPGKKQGLFLIWAARYMDDNNPPVELTYWVEALDQIHALPEGGLMIADENGTEWVTEGHFDGSYKYGVLDSDMAEAYTFAKGLPTGAWYIPGVNPGSTISHNIGYEGITFNPRRDGETYAARWQAMFDTGVEPQMVAITTFNEWHEGTQIEPALTGMDNGAGYNYRDYESLPPDGYITLTRQWVETFLAHEWPMAYPLRFRLTTTSDWTNFRLVSGGAWQKPAVVSASSEALYAGPEGERITLTQPLERAEGGGSVETVVDVQFYPEEGAQVLTFEISRGGLGYTQLEIFDLSHGEPVPLATLVWDGWEENLDNSRQFEVAVEGIGE
ncbi:MAG TPA: hypothetical protein PKK59_05715 [Anaerolineaceae bacterium]|nr:hypothetical protein [Anaerolineaceae bacterium]